MTKLELEELRDNPKSTALEAGIAKRLLEFAEKGEYQGFLALMDRFIGKPKERISQETRDITREEEIDRLAKHLKEIARKPE